MVNSFVPLYLTIAGAFLSLAIIIILRIREQKTAISNTKDIFDTYSEYVKSKLAKSKTDVTYKEYEKMTDIGVLKDRLEELNPRDKQIMIMRYGLYNTKEYTQKEVASILGISQSYISRIEKKVIKRLKLHLE